MNKYYVTSFYKFVRLDSIEKLESEMQAAAGRWGLKGLCILGGEGINATVSAETSEAILEFQSWLLQSMAPSQITFKNSYSDRPVFKRFVIKIRPEIVTLKTPEHFPRAEKNHHLTPTQWNRILKEEDDVVLIDTRNWYETKIGTFRGAVNPQTDVFTEFPKFVQENKFPKDKKILIFCTGGIRCEKGIMELQAQGFENVFQLEGGILKYLEEYPDDQFDGECFVFDGRVSLDQKLRPTERYKLCPHCGQPGATKIQCARCDFETLICDDCEKIDIKRETCSKHCAHQWQLRPGRKGRHQDRNFFSEPS